jgi:hypothetical protein
VLKSLVPTQSSQDKEKLSCPFQSTDNFPEWKLAFRQSLKTRVWSRSIATMEGSVPNPPCQHSLWEEIRAPGENPQLSVERWLTLFIPKGGFPFSGKNRAIDFLRPLYFEIQAIKRNGWGWLHAFEKKVIAKSRSSDFSHWMEIRLKCPGLIRRIFIWEMLRPFAFAIFAAISFFWGMWMSG